MVYCNRLMLRRRGLGGVWIGTRLPDEARCPHLTYIYCTWYIYFVVSVVVPWSWSFWLKTNCFLVLCHVDKDAEEENRRANHDVPVALLLFIQEYNAPMVNCILGPRDKTCYVSQSPPRYVCVSVSRVRDAPCADPSYFSFLFLNFFSSQRMLLFADAVPTALEPACLLPSLSLTHSLTHSRAVPCRSICFILPCLFCLVVPSPPFRSSPVNHLNLSGTFDGILLFWTTYFQEEGMDEDEDDDADDDGDDDEHDGWSEDDVEVWADAAQQPPAQPPAVMQAVGQGAIGPGLDVAMPAVSAPPPFRAQR